MNLFINAVSTRGKLIIFNNFKTIISEKDIIVLGNESSKLTSIIDDFLLKNNIDYKNLENIVVVSGPGSFTGVRAISLIVNTIAFTGKTKLTDISFFDLFDKYPIVKSSSKRDLFVKKDKLATIEIVKNEDILKYLVKNNIYDVYGDLNDNSIINNIKIYGDIDYLRVLNNTKLLNKKIIEPLYIKKPTIG